MNINNNNNQFYNDSEIPKLFLNILGTIANSYFSPQKRNDSEGFILFLNLILNIIIYIFV
jgi:hypothetical protein